MACLFLWNLQHLGLGCFGGCSCYALLCPRASLYTSWNSHSSLVGPISSSSQDVPWLEDCHCPHAITFLPMPFPMKFHSIVSSPVPLQLSGVKYLICSISRNLPENLDSRCILTVIFWRPLSFILLAFICNTGK